MSSPADPVVADAAATQNVNTEEVDVLPAQANEPSVPPLGRNEEAAAAVTTEGSAPPTAAATDTIAVAPTPATADTASPAPNVPGLVVADQKTPLKTPFTAPLPVSQPGECAPLTADQDAKYASVLAAVSAWTTVPTSSAKNASTAPITDEERLFLTRECLLRYLRASKWNVADAQKRLLGTLTWRREYGVLEHTPEYIGVENETGKQLILGYDNASRPCLYLLPQKQNTPRTDRQVQHLVFMLERMIDLMVPGQETLSLLVNFKETGSSAPSVGQGRHVLNILQNHYPERLGRAFIINGEFGNHVLGRPLLKYLL
jgi:CRAL/TRIO domain/CRAL/TRIO, N-terminal domain